MKANKAGISLITLIITILVITTLAATIIPSGIDKINNARITVFNNDIITLNNEVHNYMIVNNLEYPVKLDEAGSYILYSIIDNPTLLAEVTKKRDHHDIFYIVDLDKMKIENKDLGVGKTIDDYYIIAKTSKNIYYAKGIKIGDLVFHTKRNIGDGMVAILPTSAATPTNIATLTPVSSPTSILTPINTPIPTPEPYTNPIIPIGFTHVGSEDWKSGFTIQDSNGNQFVWVPVGNLTANGTLDGINFNSKFGRRNFKENIFDENKYYETNDSVLQNMTLSINTYGGFYMAKYEMSNNGSKAQSKANTVPWVSINWLAAKARSESMDTDWGWDTSEVESYLCYGAHWDTALQWLYESGGKSLAQIKDNSVTWGNYYNDTFSGTMGVGNTGKWNQTCVKGIYDLAGNVFEWTMENYSGSFRAQRGGTYEHWGESAPAAYRSNIIYTNSSADLGFRCVLYIK